MGAPLELSAMTLTLCLILTHNMLFTFIVCHSPSISPSPSPSLSPSGRSQLLRQIKDNCHAVIKTDNQTLTEATYDFGNITKYRYDPPLAVVWPQSLSDISCIVKMVYQSSDYVTVAARGRAHSVEGQAEAPGGVIIDMRSLPRQQLEVHLGHTPYVDVYGGQLWINVLNHTLYKYGLSPRSWTDYLYLTVGGTLSNAGVSGIPSATDPKSIMCMN